MLLVAIAPCHMCAPSADTQARQMCSPYRPLPAMFLFPSDPPQTLCPASAPALASDCVACPVTNYRTGVHALKPHQHCWTCCARWCYAAPDCKVAQAAQATPLRLQYAKGQPLQDPSQAQRNTCPTVATSGRSKPPWLPHQATSKRPLGAGQAKSLRLHAVHHAPPAIHPLHLSCGPCA